MLSKLNATRRGWKASLKKSQAISDRSAGRGLAPACGDRCVRTSRRRLKPLSGGRRGRDPGRPYADGLFAGHGGGEKYSRRVWACLLGGAISAVVCFVGFEILFGFPPVSLAKTASTVGNRLLLGFAIGVSGWRLPHLLHGAIMGLLFSLSVSLGFITQPFGFFVYTGMGVLYGIFIEWLSSDLLKAPMKAER